MSLQSKDEQSTSVEPCKVIRGDYRYAKLSAAQFYELLRGKVIRTVGYSLLLRFALKLIAKRLNIFKAISEPVPVL